MLLNANHEIIPVDRHYQLLATGHGTWIVQERKLDRSARGRPITRLFSVAAPMSVADLLSWLAGRVRRERLDCLNLPPVRGG